MRKIPITITLPEDVIRDMRSYISQRKISQFISELVKKEIANKKKALIKEFQEAAKDEEMNAEFEIWDSCIGDGLDEANDYK